MVLESGIIDKMIQITEKYLTFENSCIFADFELDAYAQLDVEVELDAPAELDLALGEVAADGHDERARDHRTEDERLDVRARIGEAPEGELVDDRRKRGKKKREPEGR